MLLIAGSVAWETQGQKLKPTDKTRPNINSFHRFTSETYRSAVTGCCSAHSMLININRKALGFGRNHHGQLGQSQLKTFESPVPVNGLGDLNVIQVACGRNHSLFLTEAGIVYACGDNRHGQCGIGNTTATITKATPVKYSGPPIVKVACGADFSVILDTNGTLYSFGLPEYGQLGNNSDGKYFITANKLAYNYVTFPKRVERFVEKTIEGRTIPIENVKILDFDCGNNHTVAIDSNHRMFCWGSGGYGRLGHAEQKDEWTPRLNKYFDSQQRKIMRVFCGTAFSLAITDIGSLYLFGRKNLRGDTNMYPKPVHDLAGWNINSIGAGYNSILISAEASVIAWGASPTYGELGLGDEVKSSSVPKIVPDLHSMEVTHVAVGFSHSLLLVNVEHENTKQKYEALSEFIID